MLSTLLPFSVQPTKQKESLESTYHPKIRTLTADFRHVHRRSLPVLHVRGMPGRLHDHPRGNSPTDGWAVVRQRLGIHRVLQRDAFHQPDPVSAATVRAGEGNDPSLVE